MGGGREKTSRSFSNVSSLTNSSRAPRRSAISAKFEKYRSSVGYEAKIEKSDSIVWGLDKTTHLVPWRKKLRTFLSSVQLEVFTFFLIFLDVTLSIASMLMSEDHSSKPVIFVVSGFIIIILVIDLCLRIVDLGVKKYCSGFFTVFECIIVIVSAIVFLLEAALGNNIFPTSIGRALRPAIRMTKVLRGFIGAFCHRGGLQGRLDRAADRVSDQIIDKYLGDILVIPSQNATFKPSQGKFSLQKAQVRPEAFEDLHLPFRILGGAIEFFIFDLDLANERSGRGKGEEEPGLVVAIHNVIVVLGPGQAYPVDFEEVLRNQERLVDLLCRRLEILLPKENKKMNTKKKTDATSTKSTITKEQSNDMGNRVQQMGNDFMKDIMQRGFHLDIQNFTIRYEDTGRLGPPTVGGFLISSLTMSMQAMEKAHQDDKDFRVRGTWRSGAPHVQQVEDLDSPQKKLQLHQGSMICTAYLQGLQMFWEVGDKAIPKQAPALAGQTVAMSELLQGIRIAQNWEKARHAVCQALCRKKEHAKSVRVWRLRERMLQHRYLLFPVNITSHGLFSPSQAMLFNSVPSDVGKTLHKRGSVASNTERTRSSTSQNANPLNRQNEMKANPQTAKGRRLASKEKKKEASSIKQATQSMELEGIMVEAPDDWKPMLDIDFCIPPIELALDPVQLSSIQKVLAYNHEWTKANNRFMWQPIAGDTGRIPAHVRWRYAMRCIQKKIYPNYVWKVSSFLELRTISAVRAAYIHEQLTHRRRTERLKRHHTRSSIVASKRRSLELQVCLPLSEILLAQAVVAETNLTFDDLTDSINSEDRRLVESFVQSQDVQKDSLDSQAPEDSTGSTEVEGREFESRRKASQFHVTLEVARLNLFSDSRRPLMRFELEKISSTICRAAPLDVQSSRAPVGFVPVPGCIMMAASVNDARIVYMSAPSVMPSMRRFLRQKPAANYEIRQPLLQVNFGKYPTDRPDDLSRLFTTMKLRHVEICFCKPLLRSLQLQFGGISDVNPGIDWFEEKIAVSRENFLSHRHKVWENQKEFESMSGLISRSLLRAEITMLGLTCNALSPFTGSLWCHERFVLTPCTLQIERGGDPAKFQFCFVVCEEASAFGGATQDAAEDYFALPPASNFYSVGPEKTSSDLTHAQWSELEVLQRRAQMTELQSVKSAWCCKATSDHGNGDIKQSVKDPWFCKAVCRSMCAGANHTVASAHLDPITPRADGIVTGFKVRNPTALSENTIVASPEKEKHTFSDFWSAPSEVVMEVLTSEALGLPDPATIEDMNFPGLQHGVSWSF